MFSPYLYTKLFFFRRFIKSIKMATTIRRQPLNIFTKYIPKNREKNGPTAQEVHQYEDLLPYGVLRLPFFTLLYNDVGNVVQDLQCQSSQSNYNQPTSFYSKMYLLYREMKEMFQTISTSISRLLHNACTTQAIPSSVYSFCT